MQRHPAGVPGGAAEELSGHAGANARRKGLPGDWVPAGEGKKKALHRTIYVGMCAYKRAHHGLLIVLK